jgi:hypothetical protein
MCKCPFKSNMPTQVRFPICWNPLNP